MSKLQPAGPAMIPLLALSLLLGGCGDGRGDITVEQKTSHSVKSLPGKGPGLGSFEAAWQTSTTGDPRLVEGQIVTQLGDGLQAYDPNTGKRTWRYREPGRDFQGYAATDGVIMINTNNQGDRINSWHTAALDASTGKILWENTDHWYLYYGESGTIGGGENATVAAGGTVVVQPDEDDELAGIDARTGDERWRITEADFDADCKPEKPAKGPKDRPLVQVRLDCGPPDFGPGDHPEVYAAVDAETGEVRWTRAVDAVKTDIIVREGLTFVDGGEGEEPEIIGPDGKRMFKGEAGSTCFGADCKFQVSGNFAILSYSGKEEGENDLRGDRTAVIDRRTGKQRVLDEETDALAGPWAADDDGKVYRISGLKAASPAESSIQLNLLPMALSVLDLETGKSRMAPLPGTGVVPGQVNAPRQVIAAGGDRLILSEGQVAQGKARAIVAYTKTGTHEPLELGGVRPEEWPDPCKLLAGVPREEGDVPEGQGRVRVGQQTIPRTSCGLETPDGRVGVAVNWVSRTEKEAASLVQGTKSTVIGVDEEVIASSQSHMYRIGRMILTVEPIGLDELVRSQIVRNVERAIGRRPG